MQKCWLKNRPMHITSLQTIGHGRQNAFKLLWLPLLNFINKGSQLKYPFMCFLTSLSSFLGKRNPFCLIKF